MASIYFSVFLLAQKRWAVADHFIAELADFDFADDEGGLHSPSGLKPRRQNFAVPGDSPGCGQCSTTNRSANAPFAPQWKEARAIMQNQALFASPLVIIRRMTTPVMEIRFSGMSAAEIIEELPRLTETDRRAIRQKLVEIANADPDVALCNQSAMEGPMMLDGMEDDDARRQSR